MAYKESFTIPAYQQPHQQEDTRPPAMQNVERQAMGEEEGIWDTYRVKLKSLRAQSLSDEQFNNANVKLNEATTLEINGIRRDYKQQMGKLQQIQDMVQQRRLSEDEGFRAMQQASSGPVPRAESKPFGWSSLNTMAKSMVGFAKDAEARSNWGWDLLTRKSKEPKKLDSMISAYKNWMAENAYDEFTPRQQEQADLVWDSIMRAEDKYSPWFSDKEKHKPDAKVLLLREQASGRENLRTSYGSKKVGTTSPMGNSIVPKPRKPQTQGRSDPLGLGL